MDLPARVAATALGQLDPFLPDNGRRFALLLQLRSLPQ
jgi:hypothetical protein